MSTSPPTDRVAARRAAIPAISYPPDLPVSARVDDLAAALSEHRVVVVAGETGSGKSTQLPKICLALGRGVAGMIGHTQPRRIAARALAERISDELGTEVGTTVGYQIRFGDHTAEATAVKLMTDGILLAEIGRDPLLRAYDTIIIDEAHERSLNIDFLLGYLHRLLPRRPDLKLIITSATIDPQRFAAHFGDAPVVEVSGRTYPVEIRYRPYGPDVADDIDDEPDETDQPTAITRAVDELLREPAGDILVFLAGERQISDTADVLRAHLRGRGGSAATIEVLPLFGRLSIAEQHKVFAPSGRQRIVLATNVAETSLTVPGIRYVIDPGTARISRYSLRSKVQRLPIERISQASAEQRAGRCGRVADGICIRLYSRDDFASRPEFTDPEIARTSLASVILQMASLDLGPVTEFPFLDPPEPKQVTDGVTVLRELGALRIGRRDQSPRLTAVGRRIARLPVDPRLARILVEAQRRDCLEPALAIVAALAIRDVREYPQENRDAARTAHARFADPTSDFLSIWNLWRYLLGRQRELSGTKFRRLCRDEFLHFLRIREWQDLHRQLARAIRFRPPPQPSAQVDAAALHTALAAGLLSHIASRIERDRSETRGRRRRGPREYQGTRGSTLAIWPGSALATNPPPFLLAAELVETSRLWARTVAAIDPAWIERLDTDLLRRSHSEPRWSRKRQTIMATERVQLLGVTIVPARTVSYARIDPVAARELFIRHALVDGEAHPPPSFLDHNQRVLDEIVEAETRARRHDIAIDEEALFTLYDQRLPAGIADTRSLNSWWRTAARSEPDLLTFTTDMLIAAGAELVDLYDYPDQIHAGELTVPLGYVFEPGTVDDGISATIPLAALPTVDPDDVPAHVPGMRRELALALIRSLPKQLRRHFVPAPDVADAALRHIGRDGRPLTTSLAAALTTLTGIPVDRTDFDRSKIPDHLRMTYHITDADGRTIATGKDLGALKEQLHTRSRQEVARTAPTARRTGLTTFPDEPIPQTVDTTVAGTTVTGYPALTDEGATVGVTVCADRADQQRTMRAGTRRLLTLVLAADIRSLPATITSLARPQGPTPRGARPTLTRRTYLQLLTAPHGSLENLVADAATAAIDALLDWAGAPAWNAADFARVTDRIRGQLERAVLDILVAAAEVLDTAATTAEAITTAEQRAELDRWVRPGFLTAVGAAHLPDVVRYLKALAIRAERAHTNPARDAAGAAEIAALEDELETTLGALRPERRTDGDVRAVQRLIAEYRIALFAQPMRTSVPVSAKRVRAAMAALAD